MARARGVDIIGPMSVQAATADEQLMHAYAGGDATAFETLYDRHAARVWRYILRSTGDAATADDLAQEVWFSVARQAGQYAPRASAPGLPLARFTTWLFTLARHRVIDHLRARRPQASLDAPVGEADDTLADTLAAPSGFGPLRRIETRQQAAQLLAALAELPTEQREAFLLQAEAEMSVSDIAVATGVGVETAKSRLRYARAALRRALENL